MNKMKSPNLLVALSLTMMIAACGKSMSLQVAGESSKAAVDQTTGTIDTAKIAQTNACKPLDPNVVAAATTGVVGVLDKNEALQAFSEYDMNELKTGLTEGELLRRATMQIPPKEAVSEVKSLKLTLKNVKVKDITKTAICIIETECHPLTEQMVKGDNVELDVMDVFGVSKKTDLEKMDWIYANSTEFARPGYRKFRFSFVGLDSLEGGELVLQVGTNEKLPADFATKPTCYEHGDEDTREPAPVTPATVPTVQTTTPPVVVTP